MEEILLLKRNSPSRVRDGVHDFLLRLGATLSRSHPTRQRILKRSCGLGEGEHVGKGRKSPMVVICKVANDINILDLRTRYRTKLDWFFRFRPIQIYRVSKSYCKK